MSGTGFCVACFPFSLFISKMLFGKGGVYRGSLSLDLPFTLNLILSFSLPYNPSTSRVSTTIFSSFMTLFGKGGGVFIFYTLFFSAITIPSVSVRIGFQKLMSVMECDIFSIYFW